jgi:hypothetical protein
MKTIVNTIDELYKARTKGAKDKKLRNHPLARAWARAMAAKKAGDKTALERYAKLDWSIKHE